MALKLRKQPTQRLAKLDYLQDGRFRGRFDVNPRYANVSARARERGKRADGPSV